MSKKSYRLTKEGLEDLKQELKDIEDNKIPSNLKQLKEAREQGDLSENADYDAARNEQAKLATRKNEIEEILKFAKIVKSTNGDSIDIGKDVKIKYVGKNRERTVKIVSTIESNPAEDKISTDSALGKALTGKNKGDKVVVKTPVQTEYTVEILDVANAVAK